jgi:hypothetical protein
VAWAKLPALTALTAKVTLLMNLRQTHAQAQALAAAQVCHGRTILQIALTICVCVCVCVVCAWQISHALDLVPLAEFWSSFLAAFMRTFGRQVGRFVANQLLEALGCTSTEVTE